MFLLDTNIISELRRGPHKGMRMEYTAVAKLCGEWWIGWNGELPAVALT